MTRFPSVKAELETTSEKDHAQYLHDHKASYKFQGGNGLDFDVLLPLISQFGGYVCVFLITSTFLFAAYVLVAEIPIAWNSTTFESQHAPEHYTVTMSPLSAGFSLCCLVLAFINYILVVWTEPGYTGSTNIFRSPLNRLVSLYSNRFESQSNVTRNGPNCNDTDGDPIHEYAHEIRNTIATVEREMAPRASLNSSSNQDSLPLLSEQSFSWKPCRKCHLPKSPRTHHCSACNRCVMRMDHHCPWYVLIVPPPFTSSWAHTINTSCHRSHRFQLHAFFIFYLFQGSELYRLIELPSFHSTPILRFFKFDPYHSTLHTRLVLLRKTLLMDDTLPYVSI